jgi:hypothetical protein
MHALWTVAGAAATCERIQVLALQSDLDAQIGVFACLVLHNGLSSCGRKFPKMKRQAEPSVGTNSCSLPDAFTQSKFLGTERPNCSIEASFLWGCRIYWTGQAYLLQQLRVELLSLGLNVCGPRCRLDLSTSNTVAIGANGCTMERSTSGSSRLSFRNSMPA